MNKLTKASIAGAAGIALLLGGAGTLATWNDSANIEVGSIESGTLTITGSQGDWDDAPERWVPGDSYTYTGTLTISATGDNLEAELSVNTASLVSNAFADALEVSFTAAGSGIGVENSGVYPLVSGGPGTFTVTVTVTVEFPENSVTGTTGQGLTVDLDAISFVLQQVVAP